MNLLVCVMLFLERKVCIGLELTPIPTLMGLLERRTVTYLRVPFQARGSGGGRRRRRRMHVRRMRVV
jgi:hypothetical protein